MSWKFWKKEPKIEIEVTTQAVPYSTLYRWFCYDVGVSNLNELDTEVGLVPISDELKEMEERESDLRLNTIQSLLPFIDGMAELSSMVFVQTQMRELIQATGATVDEEELDKMLTTMSMIQKLAAFASIVGAFSSAAALGIISVSDTEISEMVGDPHEHE